MVMLASLCRPRCLCSLERLAGTCWLLRVKRDRGFYVSGYLRRDDLVLTDRFFSYGLRFRLIQSRAEFFRHSSEEEFGCRSGPFSNQMNWSANLPRLPERASVMPRQMELLVIYYQIPGFRPAVIVALNMT